MSDLISGKGSCLCGLVTITASSINKNLGACHCGMCRKWGGGPLLAVDCGKDVSIDGEDSIGIYSSSEWAERGFCKKCGTHLFYRFKGSSQYTVPAGIFNENTNLNFDHQIFIDEKPDYYSFSNETKNMTGAEVFEMYAPKK